MIQATAWGLFILLVCGHFITGEWHKLSRIGRLATWLGSLTAAQRWATW